MRLFDLSGKVAAVTGGNGGIGLAMAKGLAEAGASVVVGGRNEEKNAAAVTALQALGAEADSATVDVTDPDSCRAFVAGAADRFGALQILINNAGTSVRRRPEELSYEDWRMVHATNVDSAFLCSQAAYPHMVKAGGGKIINIGSLYSLFGSPVGAAYGSSKGAVVQLSKALAMAWAKDNIQVNTVLPGWIDTELTVNARAQVPELNDNVLRRTPSGRWGRPDDLTGVAVFLASAASDFVTASAISVDGGYGSVA